MSKLNNGDVTDVLDSFFIVYAIDEDDDEATVQELMQQRSDMSESVNEWYAKAKAWDRVYEAFEKAKNEHEFSNGVCTVMNEYESGESND